LTYEFKLASVYVFVLNPFLNVNCLFVKNKDSSLLHLKQVTKPLE